MNELEKWYNQNRWALVKKRDNIKREISESLQAMSTWNRMSKCGKHNHCAWCHKKMYFQYKTTYSEKELIHHKKCPRCGNKDIRIENGYDFGMHFGDAYFCKPCEVEWREGWDRRDTLLYAQGYVDKGVQEGFIVKRTKRRVIKKERTSNTTGRDGQFCSSTCMERFARWTMTKQNEIRELDEQLSLLKMEYVLHQDNGGE
tara:strand:+ start:686 stop:1288 length:603 start_codon:yes stop_codon:yes gene_type:complete